MAAYIADPYTRVYTLASNDTVDDNSHFTMSDVDTMPCILALIMSCFSGLEILYVTVKTLLDAIKVWLYAENWRQVKNFRFRDCLTHHITY
jgi:hypothetical protein